jgi:hypothetical protein
MCLSLANAKFEMTPDWFKLLHAMPHDITGLQSPETFDRTLSPINFRIKRCAFQFYFQYPMHVKQWQMGIGILQNKHLSVLHCCCKEEGHIVFTVMSITTSTSLINLQEPLTQPNSECYAHGNAAAEQRLACSSMCSDLGEIWL